MKRSTKRRSNPQLVGAYGEKAVEAELLRLGWIPSNVNRSVKNAQDFDIFALKNRRVVCLRVKTCGPSQRAFQFNSKPGKGLKSSPLDDGDFTILVRMGEEREDDQFYVVPTTEVRRAVNRWRLKFISQPGQDGELRKDVGHWTLRLDELRTGEDRPNYGYGRKWYRYLRNWDLLDGRAAKRPRTDARP